MGAVAVAVSRLSSVRRLVSARVQALALAPVLVVIVLFKLVISDGGRYAPAMAFAQVAVYLTAAMLLLVGVLRRTAVGNAVAVMVGLAAVTALWSVRPDATIRQVLQWLLYLGILAITASALRSLRAVRWFADAIVVIAGWLCLVALFMFWGAGNPGMRWYSTFYWPNPFAAFLLLALPVEMFRYVHASQRDALAHGCLSVLLAVSFVLTYSRGAWLSLAAIVPVAAVVLRPPSWPRAVWRTLVLAAAVAAAVVMLTRGAAPAAGEEVLNRAASVTDATDLSIQGRLNFWRSAWAIFLDHPLGTGAGTFGAVHAAYQRDVRFYSTDAHNLYLQMAAEMGVPGVIALASVLATAAVVWVRALRQARGTELYPVVAGAGIALLAFVVHSGIEMNWMFPANPATAFALVGLLVASDQVLTAETAAPPKPGRWRVGGVLLLCLAAAAAVFGWAAQEEFVRGQASAQAGNWSEAARAYARAERWNPLQPRYPAALAAALLQVVPPEPEAAEAALRRAMAVDRMNASPPIQLASLLTNRPEAGPVHLAEAEALLKQALALDPWNRPEAYRMLAGIYLRQGRSGDADRLYRQVVPRYLGKGLGSATVIYALLWPEVTGLVLDATDLAVRLGDTGQAEAWLRSVLSEDPGAIAAALRLSGLYLAMGRVADARGVLEATAAWVPDSGVIREALDRLR